MIKEVLRNLTTKKKTVSIPDGYDLTAEDSAKIIDLGKKIDRIFGRSMRIRQVDAGSCNACEWECIALTNPVYDLQRFGLDIVASPRHADALLVTGPVSRQMELALRKTWIATPEPKFVIACGACTVDGGVFRDSYAVTNGVGNVIPVDCYIPGCPPSPMQIVSGILELLDKIVAK